MPDEKQLRKKVLLRLLGSPLTVAPFMLGMTSLTAVWALDLKPGIGLFAGLAGILAACGIFFTRLLLSGEKITQEAAAELDREEQAAKQKALDDLERHLAAADSDPRPETALRDLRALVTAFEEFQGASDDFSLSSAVDIQSMVNQLFDQCVQSLEHTAKLWQTARQLNTPAARQPILTQREKIIADVQGSIKQLSDTLVALQNLGASNGSTPELARIRDELDQSLAVAKRVDARLNSLVKDLDVKAQEQPQQINPQAKG